MADRKLILLRAAHELLMKQQKSGYTLNLLEQTVFYDEADCDGHCLMEDIALELEESSGGVDVPAAPHPLAGDPRHSMRDDEAFMQHQRDRIAAAQQHDAEEAKPKLADCVGVLDEAQRQEQE